MLTRREPRTPSQLPSASHKYGILASSHIVYMQDRDMQPENMPKYWILGLRAGKTVTQNEADIIAWAWRWRALSELVQL